MYNQSFSERYDTIRRKNCQIRPPPQLPHTLNVLHQQKPTHFREILRVNPSTFDHLLAAIEDDPVFGNNSRTQQAPVEWQLAVALYRFGHSGNGVGQTPVSRWAGLGHGTVALYTKKVLTAILCPRFMNEAIRLPTDEEKEKAKRWVENHSCRAWRNGWCLVDGALVPLFDRPHWYAESYFDRKCNYSLNLQVCFSVTDYSRQ